MATKRTKRAKPAKSRAKPTKTTRRAAKAPARVATPKEPATQPLAFAPAGSIPAWPVTTTDKPAFDIVHEPKDLRPLATPIHVLEGHRQFVQALAFSPDGKWLVTASEDGSGIVWDLAGPTRAKTLTGHDSAINCVSFTPDGKHLLTACDDHAVRVFAVPSFELVRALDGHTDYVSRVFPAGDGRCASCSKDGTVRIWNVETGEQLHEIEHGGWVTALGTSHDGRFAVASSDRNKIVVYAVATGEPARVLLDASGDYIGEVMGMTLASDNTSGVGHKNYPKAIVFGPDDTTLLSSEVDLIEWDFATGNERGRTDGDGWPLSGIAFIPDRATTLREHADDAERELIAQLERDPHDAGIRTVYGDWLEARGRLVEASSVRRLGAFRYVLAGSRGAVQVFDLGLGTIVAQASWTDDDLRNVAVSPNGRLAASGSSDGRVALWDVDALLRAGMPDRHLSRPTEQAVTDDGIALTASSDRTAWLWSAAGKGVRLAPSKGLFVVARFTPDGRHALVMGDDGVIQIFDAKTGASRGELAGDEDRHRPVKAHAFLRDGRLLAASTSGPLTLWSIDPPRSPERFEVDAGHVTAFAVDEANDLVVTSAYATGKEVPVVKLWSIAKRALVDEFRFKPATEQYFASAAIVDDAKRIVLGTSEGGVTVIDRAGTILAAVALDGDAYFSQSLPLPDGRIALGGSNVFIFDHRAGKVVGRVQLPDTSIAYIPGTTRAVVRSPEGISLLDFATATRSAATSPHLELPGVSPSGAYLVACSRSDGQLGVPTVLQQNVSR